MKTTNLISRALVLAIIALAMSSCNEPSSSEARESTTVPPEVEEPKTLTLLGWGDYIPEETLARFTKETGIAIAYQPYENTDEALGRINSEPGRYDVILTDEDTAAQMRQRKLLGDLDHEQLPNLANLGRRYADILPDPDYTFSAPYLLGNTVLVYNTKLVENPARSWSTLWDPKAVGDGQVWMLNEPAEVFAMAHLALGHDMNTTEPADFETAGNLLLEQLEKVNVIYNSDVEIARALVEGRCAAAMLYNSNAAVALGENEDLEMALPREGVPLCCDMFLVSRETQRAELAHVFINFMLEAEVAAECAEWNWCATPNQRAEEILDPELLADEVAYPPADVLAKSAFHDTGKPDRLRLVGVNYRAIMESLRKTTPAMANAPDAEP
ncbi:MAG: spermidine/putrescine transport system substrate-binding protein [Verrucomicrobiales bacterium]|jgi:spermidine/putrescine transport system substrate-binding protein